MKSASKKDWVKRQSTLRNQRNQSLILQRNLKQEKKVLCINGKICATSFWSFMRKETWRGRLKGLSSESNREISSTGTDPFLLDPILEKGQMLSFPCFFRVTSLFSFFPPDARIHSIVIHKYIPFKRLFAPKTAVSLTVFTWSGRRKKKNGKKLKFPMNWRRLNVFSPLSVLMPNLISRVKKKTNMSFLSQS